MDEIIGDHPGMRQVKNLRTFSDVNVRPEQIGITGGITGLGDNIALARTIVLSYEGNINFPRLEKCGYIYVTSHGCLNMFVLTYAVAVITPNIRELDVRSLENPADIFAFGANKIHACQSFCGNIFCGQNTVINAGMYSKAKIQRLSTLSEMEEILFKRYQK